MSLKRKPLNWVLPPQIESRLGESSYGRQRAIAEADHLLIILHAPPKVGTMDREPVLFLRKPDGSLMCNGFDNGAHKLRELLANYRLRWEECDKAYDSADSAEELLSLLEKLAPLNRSSTNLKNALQAARDAATQDRFLISMRDESEEISRAFDLLTTDAKLKLDYRIAKNSEEQALHSKAIISAQHRLNVLASITFPIMAVATVLGMNLKHGLEDQSPFFFIMVLVLGVMLGIWVKRWVAR